MRDDKALREALGDSVADDALVLWYILKKQGRTPDEIAYVLEFLFPKLKGRSRVQSMGWE